MIIAFYGKAADAGDERSQHIIAKGGENHGMKREDYASWEEFEKAILADIHDAMADVEYGSPPPGWPWPNRHKSS